MKPRKQNLDRGALAGLAICVLSTAGCWFLIVRGLGLLTQLAKHALGR